MACRIGFVGTGGVANRHATVLAGFDDVELVGATDLDLNHAATFASAHGLTNTYPIARIGYMEVADVVEAATDGMGPPVGALVAATYGHRTAYRADPLRDRLVVLPDGLDPILGIYVAHMGPICANGLLHAAAEVVGTEVRGLGDGVRRTSCRCSWRRCSWLAYWPLCYLLYAALRSDEFRAVPPTHGTVSG